MSALASIQKQLQASKRSFSSLTGSLLKRTKETTSNITSGVKSSLERQNTEIDRFAKNKDLTAGTIMTPLVPYLAAKNKLPKPIQKFAEKDSGAVINFVKSFAFGDVKDTRSNLKTYDKVIAGKKITPTERKRLKGYNDSQMLNFVGSVDGPSSKMFDPISSLVGKKVAKDAVAKNIAKTQPLQEKSEKYLASVNTERLTINKDTKEALRTIIDPLKPQIEAITGKPTTKERIIEAAKEAEVLKNVATEDDIVAEEASLLKTRQLLSKLASDFQATGKANVDPAKATEVASTTKELIEVFKVVSTQANKRSTALRMLGIDAGDPELVKVVKSILSKSEEAENNLDDIIKAAEGVDFSDLDSITKFYRKFVKPSMLERFNEYRYVNMLSSPKTHFVNITSNAIQAMTRPVDKLASGAIDAVGSSLTGKERQMYMREVPEYVRGAINSIPDALTDAIGAMRGKLPTDRPDVPRYPTSANPLVKAYTTPLRALEAMDVFFRKIIAAGEYESLIYRELRKNGGGSVDPTRVALLKKQADDIATEYTFRKALGDEAQGDLFKQVDKYSAKILDTDLLRWFVPFVTTPTNILKQGLERTPGLGLLALKGADSKTDLLGRQLVGSMVFMYGGMLAMQNKIVGAPPKNKKDKEAFYNSGKIPYSIRIGDNWVQFSKIGPLAYPLAFAASIKDSFENDSRKNDDNFAENLAESMGKLGMLFTDQSYVDNIGTLISAMNGDEYTIQKIMANTTEQAIPYDGFIRTIARWTDDVYRRPQGFTQQIKSNLPGLSKEVGSYKRPSGNKSRRSYPKFNALSPINVSKGKKTRPK